MTDISNLGLPRTQLERLRFLEMQLLFNRRFVIKQLMEEFGITRPIASNDIKTYMSVFPDNIKPYSAKDKCFRPYQTFAPQLIDEREAFNKFMNKVPLSNAYVGNVPFLARTQHKGVLAALLGAIENGYVVEAIYASMGNPVGMKRMILPTKLIRASNRLHVRAYCLERKEYRDFTLSRFLNVPRKTALHEKIDKLPKDSGMDTVVIIVIPNPALPEKARLLIESEFEIKQERKYLVEAFAVQYFLQDNLLPSSEAEHALELIEPLKYPLVVKNWSNIKASLFAAT